MGGIGRGIGRAIKKVVKKVTGFVGDFFGFNIKPMGAPDVGGGAEQEQGVLLSKTGTIEGIPVIYGYRRVGGTLIFVETSGTNNAFLYACYVICEGEIAGIKKIFLDDNTLEAPANGAAMYPAETQFEVGGRYSGRIKMQFFMGTEGQAQSSLLNELPSWASKKRTLPGVAYAAMRFEWKPINDQADADNNPYQGGVPRLQLDVHGKKIYDVTTHTSGAQLSAVYGSLTKTYTGLEGTNPANCLLDYLMNPRYGCGISRDEIDAASFKTAATKLNQTVTYFESTTGPIMTCCAALDSRSKLLDNVKILIGGARAILPYVQGRYRLIVEDGGHPTDITSAVVTTSYDVDVNEIVGGITLTGETKTSKYNQVIVNYVDPNRDFTVQQVFHNVAQDLAIDDDEPLSGEFTFGTLTNEYIAKNMARYIYLKSRTQTGIEFTATQELINLVPGDIIRITDTVLNLNLKTYRIINMKLNVDGNIGISGTEHVATIYPYVRGDQQDNPNPTPDPEPVPTPIDPPPTLPPEVPPHVFAYATPILPTGVALIFDAADPVIRNDPANTGTFAEGWREGAHILFFPVGSGSLQSGIQLIAAPTNGLITHVRFRAFDNNKNEVRINWNTGLSYPQGFTFGSTDSKGQRLPAGIPSFIMNKNLFYEVRGVEYIQGKEKLYNLMLPAVAEFFGYWAPGLPYSSLTLIAKPYGLQLKSAAQAVGRSYPLFDLEYFVNYLASTYGANTAGSTNLGA